MSSKLTAAKAVCCFDGVEGDAATGSILVEDFKGCDPGSGTKDPGIIHDFASSDGSTAPSLIVSNAGDDTIKPKPKVACESIIIAHKAGAYDGGQLPELDEPATSSASSPAIPEEAEELPGPDEPATNSSSSPAIPEKGEESPELQTSLSKSSLASATAHSKKKLPSLATEIWSLIIKFAMTSVSEGAIMFDCGTGRAFKPNVAVQLLRVNHATYHEAITSLYSENVFFFDHFGSDLKVIDKSVGLSSCLLGSCPRAMIEPKLKKMVIHIGSEYDMYMGSLASRTFQYALRALRYKIHVEELLLHILPYAFLSEERAKEFAAELIHIKLSRALIITGSAAQYDYDDVYTFAAALGMDPKPVERYVQWDDRCLVEQGYSYHRFKAPSGLDGDRTGGRTFGGGAIARASSERAEAIAI